MGKELISHGGTMTTPWSGRIPELQRNWLRECKLFRKAVRDKVVAFMRENPRGLLLDAGCGTGILREHLPNWVGYVGLDFTPDMIYYCKKSFEDSFILAKIEEMPFPDNYFCVVVSVSVINHNENWKPLVKEMVRVSKNVLIMTNVHNNRTVVHHSRPLPVQIRFNPNELMQEFRQYGNVDFSVHPNKRGIFNQGLFTITKG